MGGPLPVPLPAGRPVVDTWRLLPALGLHPHPRSRATWLPERVGARQQRIEQTTELLVVTVSAPSWQRS